MYKLVILILILEGNSIHLIIIRTDYFLHKTQCNKFHGFVLGLEHKLEYWTELLLLFQPRLPKYTSQMFCLFSWLITYSLSNIITLDIISAKYRV